MATILQLGAGKLMTHSIKQIQALGHEVYAVDKNRYAPGFMVADGHSPIDLVNVSSVTAYAHDIGADAVIAVNEAGVITAAQVSKSLGLRGLEPYIALDALDKGLMRQRWQTAQLPQPTFEVVKTADAIADAAERIGYPLIIKPTMNWGSRGISLVNNPDDLAWAVDFASQHQRDGDLIVEQFIDGTEMTVEGLIRDGEIAILAKSDKTHQPHPKYRVAMSLHYPANFDAAILEKTDQLIMEACQALKLDNCAFHAEVMVTPEDDIYLIELGARPGGGHIFGQIVEAVSGVSMPQALVQILLGEDVDIQPRAQNGAVYRFFAPPPGIFKRALGVEVAKRMPGVLDLGFFMVEGREVRAIEGDADRPGYCVAVGTSREEAIDRAEKAIGMIHFEVEPLP